MDLKEPKVYIRMMGSFSISVDGKVSERMMTDSPKGLSLIELLYLADGEPVPFSVTCVFWREKGNIPVFI